MVKKKGPPYMDDPGCKYVVIEDPWPGGATGKARTEVFFNRLCTWVYFMLGKAHEVEAVYSVNTRDDVIVQLPQDADLTPILGAHPWRRVLSRGDARDKDRVSYVFEYNYRNRGEPGNHNWLETFPTVRGDPPARLQFPVIFPYPHVSWATPRGKNCVDLALPLPPTRQPTPVPDTSGFEPYQHPSQLSSSTVENANARLEDAAHPEQRPSVHPVAGKLGKLDPYDEETNALRSLKHEPTDGLPSVKREASDVRVKPDPGVKAEPEPVYGPSKAFRQAVERLQDARAGLQDGATGEANNPAGDVPVKSEAGGPVVKREPEPYGPSKAFRGAVERLQQARATAEQGGRDDSREAAASAIKEEPPNGPSRQQDVRIKQDAVEDPIPAPSESFRAAFDRIRGRQSAPGTVGAKPADHVASAHQQPAGDEQADPRPAPKRVKEEDQQESGRKRLKSESTY